MRNLSFYSIAAAFLAMLIFCSIGFAQVNDLLVVEGNVTAEPPNSVYIVEAEFHNASGGGEATAVSFFHPTLLQSSVTLGGNATDKVYVRIVVKNNTSYEYTFDGIKYLEETYSNPDISVTTEGITYGDELAIGEEKTFYAVFSYKNNQVSSNRTLTSLLNFSFVLKSEFVPEAAVDGAVERFEEILNSSFSYKDLIDAMEKTSGSDRPDSSYIGNVIGSSGQDSEAVHALFTKNENGVMNDYLTLTVGDQTVAVTVIIKRENADSNGDTEDITLYLTPETPSGLFWRQNIWGQWVNEQHRRDWLNPVYAVVFRYESDSDTWVQLTPLFEGKARETVYGIVPENHDAICDSFTTDTWIPTQTYYGQNPNSLLNKPTIHTLTTAAINSGYTPN